MENYAKLCFNCNELPKDIEQSAAYFRRLLIIPFQVAVPESRQDKQLARNIIETELPGIFNWVLRGLARLLKKRKFTQSEILKIMLEDYRRESDSVAMFTEENSYAPDEDGYELLKDLYPAYRSFCLDDGYKPLNKKNFKKRLEVLGFFVNQTYDGNRVYLRRQR